MAPYFVPSSVSCFFSGEITGDLAITFDKYLSDDDNEHEVDEYLPEMLLYRGVGEKIINVDAPRVPLSEVEVPGVTVSQESSEAPVPTDERDQISNQSNLSPPPEEPPPTVVNSILWLEFEDEKDAESFIINHLTINNMTLEQGKQKFGNLAITAADSEIMQLHNKPTWVGIRPSEARLIPKDQVIKGKLFLKDKYLADGEFDKLKARYVTRGDMVPEDVKSFIDSPTVSNTAVLSLLAIARAEGRYIASDDVPMAYPNAKRSVNCDRKRIYMKLNQSIVKIILRICRIC